MGNFYRDNDDLLFYFDRGIDWGPLIAVTEHDFTTEGGPKTNAEALEFYREVADLVATFAAEEIAPRAAIIDRTGVKLENGEAVAPKELDAIFAKIRDMGLHGLCVPRELGGQNAPLLLYFVVAEMLARADVSTMAHFSFHGGMAMAMLVFSMQEGTTEVDTARACVTKTRFEKEIAEIVRGDAWGSMDITEPDAGSDMAKLVSKGEQDEQGNWFVTGQKIFITSGHGKHHFVIARTEKAASEDDPFAGLKGLSMFLVPAYEDTPSGRKRSTVTIDRLEEKLGHHGSATAALSFDRAPAHLIGKRGDGFEYMLTLMNNARLGVGFESLGLCEAAYRAAAAYASERRSMGKTIDKHEMIADYLDEMRTDIQGIRALAMYAGYEEELGRKMELSQKFRGRTGDEVAAKRHRRNARRVTPLLKYLAAEKSVEMAQRSIQIHGGNGYIAEYPPEKLLRDAMVMPIYEGTSQIQSLMAMRDTLTGILKNPREFVRRTAQSRWRSISARDPLERRAAKIELMARQAEQHLLAKTAGDKLGSLKDAPVTEWPERFLKNWDPKRDFAYAMLHAERLTRLRADAEIVHILVNQARKHADRRELLERYVDRAEPRCRFLLDEIVTTGARVLRELEPASAKRHSS